MVVLVARISTVFVMVAVTTIFVIMRFVVAVVTVVLALTVVPLIAGRPSGYDVRDAYRNGVHARMVGLQTVTVSSFWTHTHTQVGVTKFALQQNM